MVTFDETEGILFSGDAFGCFGALNGGVVDTNINTDIYWNEMVRYYSNIVGKYGAPVQIGLTEIAKLENNDCLFYSWSGMDRGNSSCGTYL